LVVHVAQLFPIVLGNLAHPSYLLNLLENVFWQWREIQLSMGGF
jgi:hypothetical protein